MSLRMKRMKEKERRERRRRYIVVIGIAVIAITIVVYYAKETGTYKNSRAWSFDSYAKGVIPEGFSSADKHWSIVADHDLAYSKPNVIMHSSGKDGDNASDNSSSSSNDDGSDTDTNADTSFYLYSLLINSEGVYSNFKASVNVKMTGNGSAGLVFRFIDSSHYFVLMIDAANDRFSLCRMDPGRLLCLQDASVSIENDRWYHITAHVSTQAIVGYLDGEPLLKRYDQHYMSGMVGLWARSNTSAFFDDLQIYY
ncbi:hypothetical protein [Candidatus Nitrosocaldus cavascurensis]|jgi:hypothetical protein|uniref:3-keto-disaccharide hydrolase domain-containing protein n=2 Tax=Candidatus Nitrosocaldus TaxID=498374 RepID=A0A2K5AQG8_9ARCH|nr:hypothetical protein [Candidatus Nitrosocaldus cavascurensis]SPC33854.1 conserved protein of unknown function [Candidatus Nitrosocaldus cavascurensis]